MGSVSGVSDLRTLSLFRYINVGDFIKIHISHIYGPICNHLLSQFCFPRSFQISVTDMHASVLLFYSGTF